MKSLFPLEKVSGKLMQSCKKKLEPKSMPEGTVVITTELYLSIIITFNMNRSVDSPLLVLCMPELIIQKRHDVHSNIPTRDQPHQHRKKECNMPNMPNKQIR